MGDGHHSVNDMNYVIFQNDGLVDLRAVTSFGVSSKETADAIGYFGTGLKYAIAILLRNGCDVTLMIGHERYDFGLERTTIRVDEFDFVTMTSRKGTETLAFTTKMGQEWDLWMAYRELWSNTQDEKGTIWLAEAWPDVGADTTTVIVRGSAFVQQHMAQGEVVLQNNPDTCGPGADAHAGEGASIYYRGIRVKDLKDKKAIHNYNITNRVDLTEDRTLKYDFQALWAIRSLILTSDDEAFIERCLLATRDQIEHDIDYMDAGIEPSKTWMEVVARLRDDREVLLSVSADLLYKKLSKKSGPDVIEYELNEAEQEQFDRALIFVKRIGFPADEYPILFTEFLGDGVLAQALMDSKKIVISKRCFLMGTKVVAAALLEEFVHLRYKLMDETRDLQTFLFEQVLTLGERITGEKF